MRVRRRLRWLLASFAAVFLGAATWAAAAPVRFDTREELFEIPKGTWKRRMAGEKIEILPRQIRLVAGARDVLVLRNRDDVPQTFGPALMMPGQSFRLPFERAAEYQFACTAHASGQMTVIVSEPLSTPWARLRWRAGKLLKRVTWLQQEG
ncbi:MAG TPA: hypothetical protein VKZ18_18110 [Polyangia bacterium]|nr:hypothetical protein [Polyangia bacterium]